MLKLSYRYRDPFFETNVSIITMKTNSGPLIPLDYVKGRVFYKLTLLVVRWTVWSVSEYLKFPQCNTNFTFDLPCNREDKFKFLFILVLSLFYRTFFIVKLVIFCTWVPQTSVVFGPYFLKPVNVNLCNSTFNGNWFFFIYNYKIEKESTTQSRHPTHV